MPIEQWKNIKGFNGKYQISNYGRVKSFAKDKNGYILSAKNKTGWYLSVRLSYFKNSRTYRIHQLVAEHFLPNPKQLPEINHIDSNKQNNHVDNLEWISRKDNMAHAIKKHPKILSGIKYYNKYDKPRPVVQLTMGEKEIKVFQNSKIASRLTGVCARNILQVASKDEFSPGRIRKQAGGYKWKYYDEIINND